MKYLKWLVLLLVLAVAAICIYFVKNPMNIERQSITTIISSLQKTKELDKLYTGVYHIPVIDIAKGYLKRDMLKEGIKCINPFKLIEKGKRFLDNESLMKGDEGRAIVKGCCSKKYEVAVGYDHLLQILENETMIENACKGNISALPDPQILAVNCKSTSSYGKYDSSGECYSWDSDHARRQDILSKVMASDGILEQVNTRGKESLKNLLMAFCK